MSRVLFFTLHKSASTFVHRVCADLSLAAGLEYFSPNAGAHQIAVREMATNPEFWRRDTGCFGPLRLFIPVPRLEHDRVILHLRDPRDALVSMFFSYCYSHPGEIAGDTGYRRQVADRGIDEFVLQMAMAAERPVKGDYGTGVHLWDLAGNFLSRYRAYLTHLAGRPNVVRVSYEQMIEDLPGWLSAVASAFPIREPQTVVERAVEAYRPEFDVDGENVWSHRRKLAPGDYREKLRPQTVTALNCCFADVLEELGYRA